MLLFGYETEMRHGGAPANVLALAGAHVWRKEGALSPPREKLTADLTLGDASRVWTMLWMQCVPCVGKPHQRGFSELGGMFEAL